MVALPPVRGGHHPQIRSFGKPSGFRIAFAVNLGLRRSLASSGNETGVREFAAVIPARKDSIKSPTRSLLTRRRLLSGMAGYAAVLAIAGCNGDGSPSPQAPSAPKQRQVAVPTVAVPTAEPPPAPTSPAAKVATTAPPPPTPTTEAAPTAEASPTAEAIRGGCRTDAYSRGRSYERGPRASCLAG